METYFFFQLTVKLMMNSCNGDLNAKKKKKEMNAQCSHTNRSSILKSTE